jgi:tripartite-type tricarboxylate transporter receptor subunit TctC
VIMRAMTPKLAEKLGQQLVVDNRAGASGLIGGEMGARAPADGYTLTLGTSSNFSINPYLVKKPPYDPMMDFSPVTLLGQAALMLAVNPSLNARSTKELIQLAKARPKPLLYGSNGIGSISHLTSELFQSAAKIEMVHVSYKGGTPAVVDTIAGQVSLIITAIPTLAAQVRAGTLRALAVTGPKRDRMFPDLPTIAESGLPGFESVQWYGLFAPKGAAGEHVARLNREFTDVLRRPDTADVFAKDGSEPTPTTPADFSAFLKRDIAKWSSLIKTKGIYLD